MGVDFVRVDLVGGHLANNWKNKMVVLAKCLGYYNCVVFQRMQWLLNICGRMVEFTQVSTATKVPY